MATAFTATTDPGAPIVATYACDDERYLVSLVVSYAADEVSCPHEAIAQAIGLITDLGSADTVWCVLDRQTGVRHLIEQGDALSEWPSGDVAHKPATD